MWYRVVHPLRTWAATSFRNPASAEEYREWLTRKYGRCDQVQRVDGLVTGDPKF